MIELTLAWRPFIDPIDAHAWWWALLLPLALGISFAYKAVRMPSLRGFLRQVLIMAAQIVISMALLGAASYLLIIHILPLIIPAPGAP